MAKNDLMKNVKDTMKVGMVSSVGIGALGSMGSVPGMPAAGLTTMHTAQTGIGLANVGQLAKTGMGLAGMVGGLSTQKSKTKSSTVNKILGL